MTTTDPLSQPRFERLHGQPDREILDQLIGQAAIAPGLSAEISQDAEALVEELRRQGRPGLMEVFLEEYGLSTDEGVALMCLAEALLRVPDADTIDALIEDKIAPSSWASRVRHWSMPRPGL